MSCSACSGFIFLGGSVWDANQRKHKWNAITLRYGKLGDGAQIFAVRFDWRSQDQSIRSRDCLQSIKTLTPPHPWHDLAVIEADDQFHLHRDFAAQSFNDADDVGILAARRHEIDQANGAAPGFNVRFEN